MAEAEGGARKVEEELAVAKERLLLQENELQSKSGGGLLSYLSTVTKPLYILIIHDLHKHASSHWMIGT